MNDESLTNIEQSEMSDGPVFFLSFSFLGWGVYSPHACAVIPCDGLYTVRVMVE
jgi:hypothetical protein